MDRLRKRRSSLAEDLPALENSSQSNRLDADEDEDEEKDEIREVNEQFI